MTENFGNGAKLYTIENEFLRIKISDFGANVVSIFVKEKNRDIVLGYKSAADYEKYTSSIGATVGRYANRIAGGEFVLNGKKYMLAKNDGQNHLHGGNTGFNKRMWSQDEASKTKLTLSYFSPDGEEGYPSSLEVRVTFSVENKAFKIRYYAVSDGDTIVNLTNHSYFNLDGGRVEDTALQINADFVNKTDKGLIPVAKEPVVNTPFDFRNPKKIGKDIGENNEQLKIQNGYDCNYFLNSRKAAVTYSEKSNITLSVETDMPCLQLYTGNFLNGSETDKNGEKINFRTGFCLETQFAPNSPNAENFGGCLLKKGEKYDHTTIFEID